MDVYKFNTKPSEHMGELLKKKILKIIRPKLRNPKPKMTMLQEMRTPDATTPKQHKKDM